MKSVVLDLYARVSKLEGKTHQAKHGDVMEVIKLVCIEMALDKSLCQAMLAHGEKVLKKLKAAK